MQDFIIFQGCHGLQWLFLGLDLEMKVCMLSDVTGLKSKPGSFRNPLFDKNGFTVGQKSFD